MVGLMSNENITKGEKVRSTKNSIERGEQSEEGLEAHWGWRENNWMIFLKDTGRFLYIVATLLRDIQAKRYKHTDAEKWPKNVEVKWIGVENGTLRGWPWCCARFVHTCTWMCWNLHRQRSWNATQGVSVECLSTFFEFNKRLWWGIKPINPESEEMISN